MDTFSGEDKLRLLLLAALSCNASSSPSGEGGGSNGGSGVGGSSSSVVFHVSSSDLDRYGEQLKAAHPDLNISAIKYVQKLRLVALVL